MMTTKPLFAAAVDKLLRDALNARITRLVIELIPRPANSKEIKSDIRFWERLLKRAERKNN